MFLGRSKSGRKNRRMSADGVNSRFTLAAAVFIATLCGAGSFSLSQPGTEAANRFNDALLTIFKMSCGALITLLGGRIPRLEALYE
jgi:hypothetical protein